MTDEPVCAVCGLTEGASVSEVERRRIGYHPFEAAPSTDEGEARWARENGIPSVWRKRWMGYSETVEIPISLEAAIRAPLEERIRELEVRGSALAAVDGERIEYLEAEVERLREALRSVLTQLERTDVQMDQSALAAIARMIIRRALATPPSSTEGTDTAADEGGEE